MTDRRQKFWEQMAVEDVSASVIDISDTCGWKKKYIMDIRDREVKKCLQHRSSQTLILDLGCGCGDLSFLLSAAGFKTMGVDISYGHLQYAKNKKNDLNAIFVQMDGCRLPLLDNSVDGCCTYLVLNYLQHDLSDLLSEVFRILKPGCSFIAIEQVTRIPRTEGVKVQRPISEFYTSFTQAGFEVLSHHLVRRGHFVLIYLIRYGFIPAILFPLFARCEKVIGRIFPTPWFDYADCAFHLQKPLK